MDKDNIDTTEQQQTTADNLPPELLIEIFRHLPFFDLQKVRLVCSRWANICRSTELQNNTIFRLTNRNWKEVFEATQEYPDVAQGLMKNLCLERMSYNGKLIAFLTEVAGYVQTLRLNRSTTLPYSVQQKLVNLRELRLFKVSRVSKETKKLATVNLNNFPNLNTLLLQASVTQDVKLPLLRQLTDHGNNWHLKRLKLELIADEQELILHVIGSYAGTLTELELMCFSSEMLQLSQWKNKFQLLKKLQIMRLFGNFNENFLLGVFQSLPAEAPIKHLDLTGSVKVDDATLECILGKWSKSLENLELMFCMRITDTSVMKLAAAHDNLRALCLDHCNVTNYGLLNGIASKPNQQLRELNISGVENIEEQCICILAELLPNLEHLTLTNCSNAVTDRSLKCIFRYQTKLRTLDLEHCYKISDEGLMGRYRFRSNPGYTIQRLHSLNSLSLRGCRNISNQTLIKGLKFAELRTLKLGYCHKISAVGIEALVENCPSIETLIISSCLMLNDDAIAHIATKLKRLRSLNASNCVNLTEKSIDYIIESCQSLVELTICGIDSLKNCNVRQRLRSLKPQLKELHI